jgi:competence protein ComEC
MNNGARKGGNPSAWRIIKDAPGLEDLWQVHHSVEGGAASNAPEPFIANPDETTAHGIRISAQRDGGFTVTNDRNNHSKTYR